jgi:peptidoglycan/xylan/chitin deacetylase (PgdA/CDA1 family)
MDTDWCPEKALQYALALLQEHDLPCTVFATGPYTALQNYDPSRIEIGLHPNFNHVTIDGYEKKVQELREMYPQARGVASHAMMSSTPILNFFKQSGLQYDRNVLRYKDPIAAPFYHYNGLLRLPIFWEDDIWFTIEPGVPFTADLLIQENFRYIFNFHPIHLYQNTESQLHYQYFKSFQHEPAKLQAHIGKGYGVRSFFIDLVDYIKKQGINTGLLHEFLR